MSSSFDILFGNYETTSRIAKEPIRASPTTFLNKIKNPSKQLSFKNPYGPQSYR